MKPEFPPLIPEQDAELVKLRALAEGQRELARKLETEPGRYVGLAAARLTEAALKK